MQFNISAELKNASGIYVIRNIENNKVYIGSAANFSKRCISHRCALNKQKHRNAILQSAINKYGLNNFSFEILELCNKADLLQREQFHLDATGSCKLGVGYNIAQSSSAPNLGKKLSQQTKDKIGAANKGRIVSPETIGLYLASKKRLGTLKHTPEAKERMRQASESGYSLPALANARVALEQKIKKRNGPEFKLGQKKITTCKTCKKEFAHPWYKERIYCSYPCVPPRQPKPESLSTTICIVCKIEFEHPRYRARLCCSRKCSATLFKPTPEAIAGNLQKMHAANRNKSRRIQNPDLI